MGQQPASSSYNRDIHILLMHFEKMNSSSLFRVCFLGLPGFIKCCIVCQHNKFLANNVFLRAVMEVHFAGNVLKLSKKGLPT